MFAAKAISTSNMILAADRSKALAIVTFGDSTTAVRSTVERVYSGRLPQLIQARS